MNNVNLLPVAKAAEEFGVNRQTIITYGLELGMDLENEESK